MGIGPTTPDVRGKCFSPLLHQFRCRQVAMYKIWSIKNESISWIWQRASVLAFPLRQLAMQTQYQSQSQGFTDPPPRDRSLMSPFWTPLRLLEESLNTTSSVFCTGDHKTAALFKPHLLPPIHFYFLSQICDFYLVESYFDRRSNWRGFLRLFSGSSLPMKRCVCIHGSNSICSLLMWAVI